MESRRCDHDGGMVTVLYPMFDSEGWKSTCPMCEAEKRIARLRGESTMNDYAVELRNRAKMIAPPAAILVVSVVSA